MVKYVVGFLFDSNNQVVLIRKNRPQWQIGRLNGIGGHIEDGESPQDAMAREFEEEAGVRVDSWRQFCVVKGSEYELNCFTAKGNYAIRAMTDEYVNWYPVLVSQSKQVIPNLAWMIPMANYKFPLVATVIHESPEC